MSYLSSLLSPVLKLTFGVALFAVGGPIAQAGSMPAAERSEIEPRQGRVLRVKGDSFLRGGEYLLELELDSQGDENGIGFTLNFDHTQLSYVRASVGSDAPGAILHLNLDHLAQGMIGVGLALPGGQVLAPGVRQVLKIYFSVPQTSSANLTTVGFGDLQVAREIVDAEANVLSADFVPGILSLAPEINPTPSLASLDPAVVAVGGPAFTLIINGKDFVNGAVVSVNGEARATTFVNSTQLRADILSQDIAGVGTISLTALNPAPGGGISNQLDLFIVEPPPITPPNNPVPFISGISPNLVAEGSVAFTLTVTGFGFVAGSVVRVSGQARSTNFVSSVQLTARIPAADVARVGGLAVQVVNPEPGGGTSSQVTMEVQKRNPLPRIASISPEAVNAGGASFTLTVNGSSFVSGSAVRVNGASRSTTFVNSAQLRATISSLDIASAGTVSVTVMNPAPGGGISNPVNLSIGDPAPPNNPVPFISGISPNLVAEGSASFTLTVTGSGFMVGSVVRVNGQARATAFVNSAQLTAEIPASDVATVGGLAVQVFNPEPGGGTSSQVTLEVKRRNPLPRIASISPEVVNAGGESFTLTVNGASFVNESVVRVNGASRSTGIVNTRRLRATILSQDIASTGTVSITVLNPAPGGGISNSINLSIGDPAPLNNPSPRITEISPNPVAEGSASFTLTVTGSGFMAGSVVRVNGQARSTNFVSSAQLTVRIPDSDVATVGGLAVEVVNPEPGGGISNQLTLEVKKRNPLPRIASISPEAVNAGGASFTLTVNGSSFVNGSEGRVNGASRSTAFVNSAQLRVTISSQDIASAGTVSITVMNPAPGSGISNPVNLSIGDPAPPNNPFPFISGISPTPVAEGSASFPLTVTGSGFMAGSVVRVNGQARATAFVNSGRLTAEIPASDVATVRSLAVQVVNPEPGGGISNQMTLEVKRRNPLPRIASISPEVVNAGGASFTLTVNGSSFVNGSVGRVNGASRSTTFVNSAQLRVTISSLDIASAGTVSVTVTNPAPGGGISNTVIIKAVTPLR